jgi:small subunit ribosomal protein S20
MANHSATKKSIRQTIKRTQDNRSRMSRVRTFFRKVEEAIASKNKDAATQAFRELQPEMARAAQRNLFHKNHAARRLSRLFAKIKEI